MHQPKNHIKYYDLTPYQLIKKSISSFVKKSLLLLSKLKVANDEKYPFYQHKFQNLFQYPLKLISNSFSTENFYLSN